MASLLVIDDDPTVLSVAARILEYGGHQVLSALGGAMGVATFELHEPRVEAVLLDVLMPEVDGLTTFHHIRRRRLDVPVAFVTGSGDLLPATVLSEPHVAWLAKPFHLEALLSLVDRMLTAKPESGWRLDEPVLRDHAPLLAPQPPPAPPSTRPTGWGESLSFAGLPLLLCH